jgi:hypothetical protein
MSKSRTSSLISAKRKQQRAAQRREDKAIQARVRGLYYPTRIAPEDAFTALGRLRKQAEAEVERLIALIDSLDDEDLEPDGDFEPVLAAIEVHSSRSQETWADGDRTDLEEGHGDDEPSLGIAGNDQDLELEFDGRENDDDDAEPSLGATEVVDQDTAWAGSTSMTWEPEGCASDL